MKKENMVKTVTGLAASSAFLAFGLYHIHSMSGVTEGGLLGLNLLLEYWFHISPSVTNFVVSAICYFIGWRTLGKDFILRSVIAMCSFSVSYKIIEQFDPLWPELYQYPLLAALLGAVFVGVGTGVSVRFGGAICGDDALAMSISHLLGCRVERAYLASDLLVLALSTTYIPLRRIGYSLLTVFLSGKIIGIIQRAKFSKKE